MVAIKKSLGMLEQVSCGVARWITHVMPSAETAGSHAIAKAGEPLQVQQISQLGGHAMQGLLINIAEVTNEARGVDGRQFV